MYELLNEVLLFGGLLGRWFLCSFLCDWFLSGCFLAACFLEIWWFSWLLSLEIWLLSYGELGRLLWCSGFEIIKATDATAY